VYSLELNIDLKKTIASFMAYWSLGGTADFWSMLFLEEFILNFWPGVNEGTRFIMVGGLNTLLNFVLFHILVSLFGEEHYTLHVMLAWVVTSIFAYIGHRTFVFRSQGSWLGEYSRSVWSRLVAYFVAAVAVKSLYNVWESNVYISLFITNALNAVISYILLKYFALGRKNGQHT
jgi:putative flippase GtrA